MELRAETASADGGVLPRLLAAPNGEDANADVWGSMLARGSSGLSWTARVPTRDDGCDALDGSEGAAALGGGDGGGEPCGGPRGGWAGEVTAGGNERGMPSWESDAAAPEPSMPSESVAAAVGDDVTMGDGEVVGSASGAVCAGPSACRGVGDERGCARDGCELSWLEGHVGVEGGGWLGGSIGRLRWVGGGSTSGDQGGMVGGGVPTS